MVTCKFCDEKLSGEKEKLEHELDEHSDEMSSHDEDQKKTELNKLEQKTQTSRHKKKKMVQFGAIALVFVGLVAGGGYFAYQNSDALAGIQQTNESIGVGQPVHWHANYKISVCGENRILQGGPLTAHTHGQSQFHLEGVRETREQATLDWVVDQLNGEFSNKGILGYEEPESCPNSDEKGELTVQANGEVLENPEDYIIRDGDFIRITYS